MKVIIELQTEKLKETVNPDMDPADLVMQALGEALDRIERSVRDEETLATGVLYDMNRHPVGLWMVSP